MNSKYGLNLVRFVGAIFLVAGVSLSAKPKKFFSAPQSAPAGSAFEVTYTKALASNADGRYWITIIDSAAAESEWGAWVYVEDGAASTTLTAPQAPGNYEIRLHDRYPKNPYRVLEKASLTVE